MKFIPAVLALLAASLLHAEDRQLFNGKDLSGWKGQPEFWSVRDGAITGHTTREVPVKENTFLVWEGQVGDFELNFKYKIVDKDGKAAGFGNSGVQYRSKVVNPKYSVVAGYQADFEVGTTYSGILYEEKGRGILANRGQKVVIHEGDAPAKPRIEVTGSVGKSEEEKTTVGITLMTGCARSHASTWKPSMIGILRSMRIIMGIGYFSRLAYSPWPSR